MAFKGTIFAYLEVFFPIKWRREFELEMQSQTHAKTNLHQNTREKY
jgi:hypothetical protein